MLVAFVEQVKTNTKLDWTSIIIAFITAGGFTAAFTIREKKTGLFMVNVEKVSLEWQKVAESIKAMYEGLKTDYDRLNAKYDEQLRINSKLRHLLDDANTKAAVANLLKCDITSCSQRRPPLGSTTKEQDSAKEIESA